ncbi:unnamed protein product [Acidithrix sp. C25]|nr:unnamed protein product [Acidithrix sp. C25]
MACDNDHEPLDANIDIDVTLSLPRSSSKVRDLYCWVAIGIKV